MLQRVTTYIREYSNLPKEELRQLRFKRQFKKENPAWDDSMIRLRDIVAEYVPKNSIVLDIGCGHGNFVIDELKGHFKEAIGLDVEEQATRNNTSVSKVILGDGVSIPLPDESIDLALSLWTMEHVENPNALFKEMSRVTKSGGYIGFVTPNKRAALVLARQIIPYKAARRLVYKLYGRKEEDVFPVQYKANSLQEIRQLAKANGLNVTILEENADPSYTSFDKISYKISSLFTKIPYTISRPHIIALLRKV